MAPRLFAGGAVLSRLIAQGSVLSSWSFGFRVRDDGRTYWARRLVPMARIVRPEHG
jgi:phage head maturation protease